MAAIRYPKNILLEIERKFVALNHYPLRINCGRPPFLSLQYLGRHDFHDVYYDYQGRLSQAGIWLRQRDGKWQSKMARGGTYIDSRFEESSDVDTISACVRTLTGLDEGVSRSFGLSCVAKFTTFRESWKADKEFKIVFDRTDFGHAVGEVELEMQVTVQNEQEATEVMEKMDQKVVDFLRHYNWAFARGEPIGKLSAYFAGKAAKRV